MDFKTFFEATGMALNKGYEYEKRVIEVLKQTGIVGNIHSAAGASSAVADADFKISDKIYNLEVKMDHRAQMGGVIIRVDPNVGLIELAKQDLDADTEKLVIENVENKMKDIKKLLTFLRKQEPKELQKNILSVPFTVSVDAWQAAVSKGLVKSINRKISNSVKFITDHYKEKQTFYMQIGKSGLFYLDKNPAKLPIPQIKGGLNIEMRVSPSGPRENKTFGVQTYNITLRAQGRLDFKGKSSYTLDDPKSINILIMNML